MQRGEIVKSKAPRRWMAIFLVALAIGGVALALFWTEQSKATEPDPVTASAVQVWDAAELKCEMVRIWPLPSECLFVFNEQAPRQAGKAVAAN